MGADKSIQIKDLPKPLQDTDTKQAEEFVDKSSIRKDENDIPEKDLTPREDEPRQRNQ